MNKKTTHTRSVETVPSAVCGKKDDQTQKICTATSLHHSYDKRRCEQQNKQKETYIPTMQPMNLLGGKFSSFFSYLFSLACIISCSRCYRCRLMKIFQKV